MIARARCRRCSRPLIRQHDELFCIDHGLQVTPTRAEDRISEDVTPDRKISMAPMGGRQWTEAERNWVARNRNRMSSKAMARRLGRSEHAINQLLSKRNLRKRRMANSVTVRQRANTLDRLEDGARPGDMRRLAARLGLRYWQAYKRLYNRGITVRDADGMMSMCEVVALYSCSIRRVRGLIASGVLPAELLGTGNGTRVRLDPADVEGVAILLRAPSKHDPRRKA